jgi:hypothetical protein
MRTKLPHHDLLAQAFQSPLMPVSSLHAEAIFHEPGFDPAGSCRNSAPFKSGITNLRLWSSANLMARGASQARVNYR